MSKKPALVSTLSMSFRKAVLPETAEEAKKEHRNTLHTLVERYSEDVKNGKAEGIRNAKDLVEVMKMDLLLLGEVTDRTEQTSSVDEIRVSKMTQYIDDDDEDIQRLMDQMLRGLNDANDDDDIASNRKQQEFANKELGKFQDKEDSEEPVYGPAEA